MPFVFKVFCTNWPQKSDPHALGQVTVPVSRLTFQNDETLCIILYPRFCTRVMVMLPQPILSLRGVNESILGPSFSFSPKKKKKSFFAIKKKNHEGVLFDWGRRAHQFSLNIPSSQEQLVYLFEWTRASVQRL